MGHDTSDYTAGLLVLVMGWAIAAILIPLSKSVIEHESKLLLFERKIKGTTEDNEVNVELEIEKVKKEIKKMKAYVKTLIVWGIFFFLFSAFRQGVYASVNTKNVSFQNKLTVLAVYLNDDEIKQLRAKWVLMKSANDYKQINDDLSAYYKKYNLTE